MLQNRHDVEAWVGVVSRLLSDDRSTTALFSAQNFVTLGAVRALHRLGLQHRIALVGHDDVPLAEVVEPGITVVPQRPRELGRRAATQLFLRMGGEDGPPIRDLLEPRLVARGSGELEVVGRT